MKNYLIRTDASSSIGAGHLMRMIALGQMLKDSGQSVHFATTSPSSPILERLAQEGFTVHKMDSWYKCRIILILLPMMI